MSAIVNALDNHTLQQLGENGHVEYGWSNNIQEQILQFSFQVVRSNEYGIQNLKIILKDILNNLKNKVSNSDIVERQLAKEYLCILYKIIGQTRDIIDGKGEYTLAYMMIHTWYEFYPVLSMFALKCFVDLNTDHQYGSWKDIKYFSDYCKNQNTDVKQPLIEYAINLLNDQLMKDVVSLNSNQCISLAAKWAPREKSKFSWLYQELATNYFAKYLDSAIGVQKYEKAVIKAKTNYRKLLSRLNKEIDTLQIKQCGQEWSKIDFKNVTSISLSKQKKAFLNIKKNGEYRYPNNHDRNSCAYHFKDYIEKTVNSETEMKGKRVGMADFVKQARELYENKNSSQVERDLLNSQWRDSCALNGELGNMIPMVDISESMTLDNALNVAIALGIRISEKSVLSNRIMTFSLNPRWINLESCSDFVDKVEVIEESDVGYNTNFYKALNLILDTIIENKMDPSDVENMVLAVLSDMQIDEAVDLRQNQDSKTLYAEIAQKYADAGMRVHGKPYKPPHILFWNLRSTQGFPCLSYENNVSMMSGYSPSLLNDFCNKGIDAIKSFTPWSSLISSLEKKRYQILSDRLNEEIFV